MPLLKYSLTIGLVLILGPTVSGLTAAADDRAAPIIIDHTCTNLETIPAEWVIAAKDLLRASYGHTSHGSQPIDGMLLMMDDPDNLGLYDLDTNGDVIPGVLSIDDRRPGLDLGSDWDTKTREYLDTVGSDRNLVIWSWCGQVSDADSAYIDDYLTRMVQLESEYPGVEFVYMTGHLDGTGDTGNLYQRNNQIRDFCGANNKILYDFADIESYDPDGNAYLHLNATDGCDYDGGNWADEWCATNPGSELCGTCICAHSEPLNCNLKARAFWWMMARIAGWEPTVPATVACDLTCQPAAGQLPLRVRFSASLANNYTGSARRLASRIDVILTAGASISNWRAGTVNLDAGESLVTTWTNMLPATPAMMGDNVFTFVAVDVTPAPFNQPPHPPSGYSDSAGCTVIGQIP